MANFIIVHGTEGTPDGNWFPWLKQELELLGHTVIVPKFPTPRRQDWHNWLKVLKRHEASINKDTILIGHSLAVPFLAGVLEQLTVGPIKAAFFVSGFTHLLGNEHYDNLNLTFVERTFDWTKIKGNCKKFYVFHGDNDPYVPLTEGKELAEHLNSELIIVPGGKHLNAEFGYTKFPQLLEKIKSVI